MAGSFSSTDSSKTLSISPVTATSNPSSALITILTHAPHEFLQPSGNAIQDAALCLVKRYFDPLLQKERSAARAGLDRVYLDGFDVEQVWEQVRGVLDLVGVRNEDAGRMKQKMLEYEEGSSSGSSGGESESESESEGESEDVDVDMDMEMGGDSENEGEEEFEGFEDKVEEDWVGEGGVELEGFLEEDDGGEEDDEQEEGDLEDEAKEFVPDVHGLNDGFFSIDDFNRQTELLELQDARGGPVDEDDDDDIDLHADPTDLKDEEEMPKGNGHVIDDYEDEEEDEMNLDGDGGGENANDIMYEDFFAPPAKKKSGRSKEKKKVSWRADVPKDMDPEEELATMESDMARVRRDLFDEEDVEEDEFDMDGDPSNPMNRRSAHQKRQATLTEQIRELEAQNVAKREWVLAGEAKARDRPLNSLLEEDLDFERSGKPVPVITQEVTESLEDMIKRRILDAQFDEVIKRRPGDISEKFRRGRVELDDSKPQESLAEVYEREHLRSTNPDENPDAADEKLQKEHKEIEAIWADVSGRLDALSNWHYTPKPAKPSLAIVADTAAISMEEAQPSAAAGGMAANVSMLAPQEVYKPGKDKAQLPIGEGGGREVVGKSGAPISTREMTSDERKRRRRREKEKIRKRNAATGVSRGEVKAGSKKDVVDSLKRGNVAVIGNGGEKRDIEGKKITERRAGTSANFLKL